MQPLLPVKDSKIARIVPYVLKRTAMACSEFYAYAAAFRRCGLAEIACRVQKTVPRERVKKRERKNDQFPPFSMGTEF